jgi:hypothetical protein
MVIGLDGLRYATSRGDGFVPWSSVVQLDVDIPGTVQLVTATRKPIVFLGDFGHDPELVLAVIKARVARAALGHDDAAR